MCVRVRERESQCERETSSEKESNRKRMRTNRELHSGPIHRRIIQSDMTIHLCDQSIHIGPRQTIQMHHSHPHTQTNKQAHLLSLTLLPTRHLYHYRNSPFILIHSFPLDMNTLQRFSMHLSFKCTAPKM